MKTCRDPEKRRAYLASWRERNRDKLRIYQREHYKKHPIKRADLPLEIQERDRAKCREYQRSHREEARIYRLKHHTHLLEQQRDYYQKRKAQKEIDTMLTIAERNTVDDLIFGCLFDHYVLEPRFTAILERLTADELAALPKLMQDRAKVAADRLPDNLHPNMKFRFDGYVQHRLEALDRDLGIIASDECIEEWMDDLEEELLDE